MDYIKKVLEQHNINYMNYLTKEFREGITELTNVMQSSDVNVLYDHLTNDNKIVADTLIIELWKMDCCPEALIQSEEDITYDELR